MAFLLPALLASALRFPDLAHRPMHCDEGVNAAIFGTLLEQGRYEYSTIDYHGPTLYYLALLPAKFQGRTRYVDITEITLRVVPAAAGVLLVALHYFLVPHIGFPAAFLGAVFAAVSPAMVYYSRYFIHEMLLVCFTFCMILSGLSYWKNRRPVWAVATGACLALAVATKETATLSVACGTLALLLLCGMRRCRGESRPRRALPWRHLVYAFAATLAVTTLLFSSFLTHYRGIPDSVLAYRTYFERGAGQGTPHAHPWHYYLNLLLCFRSGNGPVWTEAAMFVLAILGAGSVFASRRMRNRESDVPRFLSLYTLLLTIIYCLIPYKVPWNVLGFLHGWALLAGIGAVWMVQAIEGRMGRLAVAVLLMVSLTHPSWQAWAASFRYSADPRNPWVYAHTGEDIALIMRRLEGLARAHPQGNAMPVRIISSENLWPLPWNLRRFSGVRWSPAVYDSMPNAPVILATPDIEPSLARRLYELPPPGEREMYMNLFDRYVQLRPQVEIRGYVAKWLWDREQQLQTCDRGSAMNPAQR